MTTDTARRRTREASCAWCGREIVDSSLGRRRKYCRQSCRQRAYEQRTLTAGTSIPDDAVILRPEEVRDLADRLFELRCAAEDLRTALSEDADGATLAELADAVLEHAAAAERVR
ncbi:hypothetical protein GOARA_065_00360 [Gordonia araii NBRC 100433]|uniref:Uncharacterized protein n=1 Tax=Gordonia araii NBRC 100433 TaxID=1073574 RepID=G7H5W7_9ACTN|nr:hypothetical protein [Gordonia araii]NNG95682.1 hypothetical protein [Gordonia araii NBRC 100433]GAB11242.1 hypothetical protein GOARA_065_00360 [Gordonia araii NBRC 100433]